MKKPDGKNSKEEAVELTSSSSSPAWLLTLCLPLWLVYISNQWSRSSLYYLVDFSKDALASKAMNVDIGFDEGQYGVLASVAFTSLYAIASLGAGVASDRYNRKTLTVLSAISWSVATAGTALSHSYEQVVLCRVAMGLACAVSTPVAYTLLRDAVPRERQALASSLYGTGASLATGLASLSILIDSAVGWRRTLEIIAVFGFASAGLSVLLLPNDDDTKSSLSTDKDHAPLQEMELRSPSSILSDVQQIVSTGRVKWLLLGSFFRFSAGLQIGVWGAPFFRMTFADSQSEYAVAQAAISIVGASLSGLLGGVIADWLFSSSTTWGDAVGRKLWVPVVGSLLAAPMWYCAIQADQSFETSMAFLAAEYFVAECWFGPTVSTLQTTVGPSVGGTAQGLFALTGAVANVAPTILPYLYGQTGEESATELSGLLAAGVCFGYLAGAFCFGMAALSPPPPSPVDDDEKVKKE
jgi:predicted MFS family arabinose efflux permease